MLRGIKPPAAFGGRLFIREALDLGLPEVTETALSSGIKNSGRPLDSGWVVQRQGEEDVRSHQRALSRRSFSSRFRPNGLA